MPSDQHRRCIRIPPHRSGHPIRQILLVRRILDDWDLERIVVCEGLTGSTEADTFDHFLVRDSEGGGTVFGGVEEGEHDCAEMGFVSVDLIAGWMCAPAC